MNDPFYTGLVDSTITRYADFLNSVPVALYRTTIEGKIVYCNRGYARIFGFDNADELIGTPVINLYRNKKDRGLMVHSILQRGRLTDLPVPFLKKDGSCLWCAVTVKAVLDDDGIVIHLDGTLRDITTEIDEDDHRGRISSAFSEFDDMVIIFDLQGKILEINRAGLDQLGYDAPDLLSKSLSDFLIPQHKELFFMLLKDILKLKSEEITLGILDKSGNRHQFECHSFLIKKEGKAHHIKTIAQDVTHKLQERKKQVQKERFQGVLEMAGGVAHRLNQPLTIINNLLNDIITHTGAEDPNYTEIVKVLDQINKMNEITQKISNIKKYEPVDYVAGIKIVDIDNAS